MMKPKYLTHTLIILAVLVLAGCKSCRRKGLEGSLIDLETAIELRQNYVFCLNDQYHIPQSLMFETKEFEALFSMEGIDKIRLYPAINTHDDEDADSLTYIMVPVNGASNCDDLSGYIFDFAQPCPYNCTTPAAVPIQAPTEEELELTIPKNWCVTKEVITDVLTKAEDIVGQGNVYGIRFHWYTNENGIMDLELRPTMEEEGRIVNIDGLNFRGVTEICTGEGSCCDAYSPLHKPKPKKRK
jgi:hypothetical protein